MIPSDPPKHDTWKPQFFTSGFAVIVSSPGSVSVICVDEIIFYYLDSRQRLI